MQLQPNSSSRPSQIPPALTAAEIDLEKTKIGDLSSNLAGLDESKPTKIFRSTAAELAKMDMEQSGLHSVMPAEETLNLITPEMIEASVRSITEAKQAKAIEEARLRQLEAEAAEPSVIASVRSIIQDYNERMARLAEPWEPSINYLPGLLAQTNPEASDSENDIPVTFEEQEAPEKTIPRTPFAIQKQAEAVLATEPVLSEADQLLTLSLENLPQRNALRKDEIMDFYQLLTTYPEEQEVWNFISRASDHPINAWVIRYNLINNPAVITLDSLESLMFFGPVIEQVGIPDTGEQKTAILYGSNGLGEGGQAEVAKVFYTLLDTEISDIQDFNQVNFKLEKSAIKVTFIDNKDSKLAIRYEQSVSQEVSQVIKDYQAEQSPESLAQFDPGKHLALPIAFGSSFNLLPLIEASPDNSIDLRNFSRSIPTTEEFVTKLLGPLKTLNLLTKKGIINADNTDQNILISPEGGVIIDLGGFISAQQIEKGGIKYNEQEGHTLVTYQNGAGFYSPAFTHFLLYAHELQNAEMSGMMHKLSVGRVIERYLTYLGYQPKEHFDQFSDNKSLQAKINHQPLDITAESFRNTKDKTIYDLCKMLLRAVKHPYQYRENTPSLGLDPDYISLEDAILILEDLVNNQK